MKVLILGAGVIGVTSAYYLAKAGFEVEVVDRQPGPGRETSFANAGEISPGYASPWAAPAIPLKALRWMFSRDAPLILTPRLGWAGVRWLSAMLRNCTSARYAVNKGHMVRLAEHSRDCLRALRDEIRLDYDGRALGTLQVFRTQRQLDSVGKDIEVLKEAGVRHQLLSPEQCRIVEPGLAAATASIAGGLHLVDDETGDCFKFTQALASQTARMGAAYDYGVDVTALRLARGRICGVETSKGVRTADLYLVALGSYSPALLRPLDILLPVYPVKGYSLTAPLLPEALDRAPQSTIMDEHYKVATTRLGNRIRIGGMAEICGHDPVLRLSRRRTLELSAANLFPSVANLREAQFWAGFRPMTPDGPPIIGPTIIPNLFLNTGHGTLGWTMSCGSAQVIADLLVGRRPAIAVDGLELHRYD
nr:D-amino acid dehydrogenase [Sphingomonas sp. Y57]